MKRFGLILAVLTVVIIAFPVTSYSKALDGITLEDAQVLNRGAWDFKFGLDFGSGAEPFKTVSSGQVFTAKVDSLRLPLQLRYGLTETWELGGDIVIESDEGVTGLDAASLAVSVLDGSGLSHLRLQGKWNFFGDFSTRVHLDLAGNSELYYGNDGVDFGILMMYGPQIGAGTLNVNLGFLAKSGDLEVTLAGAKVKGKYKSPFIFGVGYVYPYTDKFTGIFELSGRAKHIDGAKSLMQFTLGPRYSFSDRFFMDGALGIGLADGSPSFNLKVGLNWMLGNVESYGSGYDAKSSGSERWTPPKTQKTTKRATKTPPKSKAGDKKSPTTYYEAPTKYDTPKPPPTKTVVAPTMDKAAKLKKRVADANAAFNRGDYITAATHYEAAIKIQPNDATLQYNYATSRFKNKRYRKAKEAYQEAIKLNPNDVDSHLFLGYALYYLKEFAGAKREWKKVLDLDPSHALAKQNLNAL